MKLLLDPCVAGGSVALPRAARHDVAWAGEWDVDPGDPEILGRAHAEGRVLVTLDKDLGELAVLRGEPHHGVVRLVNMATGRQAEAIAGVLGRLAAELAAGGIVIVAAARLRIRPGS